MSGSSFLEFLRSPRAAVLANLALVMTGSVLALLGVVDFLTGGIIVGLGFAGIVVTLLGQRGG
ncbi:hypothetical protein GS429_13705 [Natronorubrum sp. JWXQ-INN-674]|uniref:Major facilitator superfamily (MFS) profile domain-containing protein n=1 Tax=Natronorubrum halalkaliphilum TaxID=2691917 RepID=A0A6B0VNM6_9EURY|nr:hypothetical protein [Natronorubrum halalkaliphilum]MXV63104.1 hypothetical protein [Natronorubrum halalkaliphilum]